jgi:hypothetical protein
MDDSSQSPHETMVEMSGGVAGSMAAKSSEEQQKWGKELSAAGGGR